MIRVEVVLYQVRGFATRTFQLSIGKMTTTVGSNFFCFLAIVIILRITKVFFRVIVGCDAVLISRYRT